MDTCFTMTSLFSRRVQWHFAEERIGNLQKILAAFNGPGLISRGVIIENNTFNTRLRLRSQRVNHFQSLFMQEFDKVHSLFTQPSTEAKQSHLTFVQSAAVRSWMTRTNRALLLFTARRIHNKQAREEKSQMLRFYKVIFLLFHHDSRDLH